MLEKLLNDFLSKLGAGSREMVYLSVTPGVGLELIQVDPVIKSVKTYAYKPLEYSESMREIANYDDFKTALQELFTELNINPKCNIVLSLPMVHFGKMNLPLLLGDDAVAEAIVSEVEQAYIFKRCEPVVSWFEANTSGSSSDTRTIFYSAVQKTAVDKIKEILTELGAVLSGLEISLISTLRALSFSELASTQMTEGTSWNLMLVNSTGYSLVAMSGKNIIDYYEEPLALKTYEVEEIYNVINASAQIALMNFPTNYLYIISDTDMVSAEHLASKLPVEGKIDFFENNSFKKREVLPVSLEILPDQVMKISVEAVGVAVANEEHYPVKLEFSGNKVETSTSHEEQEEGFEETISFHFHGREILLTNSVLKKISFMFAAVLLIPAVVALYTLPILQKNKQTALDEIKSKIGNLENEIRVLTEQTSTSSTFVVKTEIEKVLKNNRTKLICYSAIGEAVPKNLWVTYFKTNNDGKVNVKGVAEDVEDIYRFFKNLKDSLINSQLRLQKLEMLESLDDAVASSGPTLYEFEITNMSAVAPAAPEAAGKEGDANVAEPKSGKAQNKASAPKFNVNKKVNDLEPVTLPD